jgi:hypothetical protein
VGRCPRDGDGAARRRLARRGRAALQAVVRLCSWTACWGAFPGASRGASASCGCTGGATGGIECRERSSVGDAARGAWRWMLRPCARTRRRSQHGRWSSSCQTAGPGRVGGSDPPVWYAVGS